MKFVEVTYDYDVVYNEATQTFDVIIRDEDVTPADISSWESFLCELAKEDEATQKLLASRMTEVVDAVRRVEIDFAETAAGIRYDNAVLDRHHTVAQDLLMFLAFKHTGFTCWSDSNCPPEQECFTDNCRANRLHALARARKVEKRTIKACTSWMASTVSQLEFFGIRKPHLTKLLSLVNYIPDGSIRRSILWTAYKGVVEAIFSPCCYMTPEQRQLFIRIQALEDDYRLNYKELESLGVRKYLTSEYNVAENFTDDSQN